MKRITTIWLFFMILKLQSSLIKTQDNNACIFNANESELKCIDFQGDLNDVKIPNNLIDQSKLTPVTLIRLKPAEFIPFTVDYVDLDGFFEYVAKNFTVFLDKFSAVDIRLTPLQDLIRDNEDGYQRLYLESEFVFKFQIGGQDLTSNNDGGCSLDRNGFKRNELFYGYNELYWNKINFNSASNQLCPLIFKNVTLSKFFIDTLTDSNKFEFIELAPSSKNRLLESNIERLEIKNARMEQLSQRILNKQVFEKIKTIEYSETIYESSSEMFLQISSSLFESFTSLNELSLSVNNMRLFFQNATSLNWLTKSLNSAGGNKFKLVLRDLSSQYDFPDSDLCLFKDFPHSRQVFPVIYTKEKLNCSCTLRWLLSEKDDTNVTFTTSVEACFVDQDEQVCDFTNFNCPTTTTTTTTTTRITRTTRTTVTAGIVPQTTSSPTSDYTATIVGAVIGGVSLVAVIIGSVVFVKERSKRLKTKVKKPLVVGDEFINIISR